jgi:hypothetical protein
MFVFNTSMYVQPYELAVLFWHDTRVREHPCRIFFFKTRMCLRSCI